MDLKNKLKGLPTIYYVNLDNRTDRKEYMESQFDYWGIKNYHRVSGTKYLASEYDKWKHLLSNKRSCKLKPVFVANFITHLEMIKNWLETSDEEYMIMMEDDYDLSLIEYWNFDWEYFMNNIPHDWDCIQLGFESFNVICFFLHPKIPGTFFGACMINRFYAEKLVRLYIKGEKFIVDSERSDMNSIKNDIANGTLDYSICNNGKVYSIPLIPQNPYYSSYEDYSNRENESLEHVFKAYKLYYDWWQNEHHKFSLDDFFTYGKSNDNQMIKPVNLNKKIKYI